MANLLDLAKMFLARRESLNKARSNVSSGKIAFQKDLKDWKADVKDYRKKSVEYEAEKARVDERNKDVEAQFAEYKAKWQPVINDLMAQAQVKAEKGFYGDVNDIRNKIAGIKAGAPRFESYPHTPWPPIKPTMGSERSYIRRFHTTNKENVPSILQNGLDMSNVRGGYQKFLTEYPEVMGQDAIFTSVRDPRSEFDTYRPKSDEVTLQIDIPKSEYKYLGRDDFNNEIGDEPMHYAKRQGRGWAYSDGSVMLQGVPYGGRTDIFTDELNPEWITDMICRERGNLVPCSEDDILSIFARYGEKDR